MRTDDGKTIVTLSDGRLLGKRAKVMIDLSFILTGIADIPADHGYQVYAAVSRLLPSMHEPNGVGIHPIRGRLLGDRRMQICDFSRLTIRLIPERIPDLLPLAGKRLNIAGQQICVGVPEVRGLEPAAALRSRLVTIKVSGDRTETRPPDETGFIVSARRQLDVLAISGDARVSVGKRRTLRIKDKEVVGYEVMVSGLSTDESLELQSRGIGGRRHMGCGIFMPAKSKGGAS
jgi:CRISPR-associated protein Cas6